MRVISLGSGSSGNALLVEAGPQGRTKLLVDAGLSARVMAARLQSAGISPSQLQAVLVTHEHSDHVQGIPVLGKSYALPVATDPRTYAAIEANVEPLMPAPSLRIISFPVGSRLHIGDIEAQSFPISHDAVAPAGYLLSAGGCRICIVTDSGEVTTEMLEYMQQADLLVLESNHDRQSLIRGPYPQMLKQRILSATGHLSNDQAADAVLKTWHPGGIRWLWLAHLSRTNNTPAIALRTMRTRLQEAGVNVASIHISALPPTMSQSWDSTQLWHAPSLWNMDR